MVKPKEIFITEIDHLNTDVPLHDDLLPEGGQGPLADIDLDHQSKEGQGPLEDIGQGHLTDEGVHLGIHSLEGGQGHLVMTLPGNLRENVADRKETKGVTDQEVERGREATDQEAKKDLSIDQEVKKGHSISQGPGARKECRQEHRGQGQDPERKRRRKKKSTSIDLGPKSVILSINHTPNITGTLMTPRQIERKLMQGMIPD